MIIRKKFLLLLILCFVFSGCAKNESLVNLEDNNSEGMDDINSELFDNQISQKDLDLYGDNAKIVSDDKVDEQIANQDTDTGINNNVIDDSDDEFYNTKIDRNNPAIQAYMDYISDIEGYFYIWNSPKAEMPVLILTDNCVDMMDDYGEDALIYGEYSTGTMYIADENNGYNIKELGTIGESSPSFYALKCDENGIYTATHHGAYCLMPDYSNGKIEVISGAEDDIVNDYFKHSKGVDILDGEISETDDPNLDDAFNAYENALRMRFRCTPKTRNKGKYEYPDSFMISGNDLTVEEIAEKYAVNLIDQIDYGKYCSYEGDIGDIVPEYKNIDLDGDGKYDTINRVIGKREGRPWNYYIINFYYGRKLEIRNEMDGFTALPNEGEVFEFYDMDKDGCDEILVTHYTFGTGGSTAWNTSMYSCDEYGEWKMIPIIGESEFDRQYINLWDKIEQEDKYYDNYRIRRTNMTEKGVDIVVDFGWKDGPNLIEELRDYSLIYNPKERCLY